MNDLDSFYLKAMCQKHGGDYQVIMNYIEVFTDLLQDIHPDSPNLIVRTYTLEEYSKPSFKIFFHYIINMSNLPVSYFNSSEEGFKITLNMNV